jgi:hypothetical protein
MDKLWLEWEYRTIGEEFSSAVDELKKSGDCETSVERIKYLISTKSNDQILFADNVLKVIAPVRFDRRSGFHQWFKVKEVSFPAHVSEVYQVMRFLSDKNIWLSKDEYFWSNFLDELILPDKQIKVIDVERELHIYQMDGVEVEYANISFSGFHNESIAIRHHSLDKIRGIRQALGLDNSDDKDYVSILKEYFLKKK